MRRLKQRRWLRSVPELQQWTVPLHAHMQLVSLCCDANITTETSTTETSQTGRNIQHGMHALLRVSYHAIAVTEACKSRSTK